MSTKIISLIIGALLIAGGAWFLFAPKSAQSPESVNGDEAAMMEEKVMHNPDEPLKDEYGDVMMMEDGTIDEGMLMKKEDDAMAMEDEPMGDPIFHALVTYTDNGFEPKTVIINKGETIRFVNQASKGMWVGGDNHPSHGIYPEVSEDDCLGTSFDTCRALAAGEFWEFTFNHVGEWGYHNHTRARDGGTVIVK